MARYLVGMGKSTDPSAILQTAFSFWSSKVLLTAVEFGVFSKLSEGGLTVDALGEALEIHPRGRADFFDALVAMGFLAREGDGPQSRYANTPEASEYLDRASPRYIGGVLEMLNARLFKFWHDLPEGLRTGAPQNESKNNQAGIFEQLYADPESLEQFMGAMTGCGASSAISVELAPSRPTTLRANSMQAICMPRQIPRNGISFSRRYWIARIFPSTPREPKP